MRVFRSIGDQAHRPALITYAPVRSWASELGVQVLVKICCLTSESPSSTPHPQINVELSRLCKTGVCIKTAKTCMKKLFRTSAQSSDGLHPNFIWLAIKTGLQIVDQISLVLDFICIEKCMFYCDSVSFQLKETTPLAKIRRKPYHFDRFPVLLPPLPPKSMLGCRIGSVAAPRRTRDDAIQH